MKELVVSLIVAMVIAGSFLGFAERSEPAQVRTTSTVVVKLTKIGWAPPPSTSDKEFFKNFTLDKLFATDTATRIVFLNEDVMAVYHTKQEGVSKDWRTTPNFIEAFFIRISDGSLLTTRKWSTGLRKSNADLCDSESRLIALHDGIFLVFANGVITTYGADLKSLAQKRLEPSSGMWSAQSVNDGKDIVIRHQATSGQVTYSWLASDTLEVTYESSGYKNRDIPAQQCLVADGDLLIDSSRGIRAIDRNQQIKTICDDPLCQKLGLLQVLRYPYIGWSGRSGIGVIDTEQRKIVWSRTVPTPIHHENFEFGWIQPAKAATRFSFWVIAIKKARFDGIEIRSDPTILVYDTTRLDEKPTVYRLKPRTDWGWALSPLGSKLALFDGETVEIISLPKS